MRKLRFISKFMTSSTGDQVMATHILPHISRSKDNQIIKVGYLIEHNLKNLFLQKSYTKCGGETSSKLFSKKSKLKISLNEQSEMLYNLLLLFFPAETCQDIFKLKC